MFGKNFKIKSWKIVNGRRVVVIHKKGPRRKPQHPCVVCGKSSLNPYCSVRCVNDATTEQKRNAQKWPPNKK